MIHCARIYLCVLFWRVGTAIDVQQIQIVPPSGIMFRITDEGYNLVGVHYSINTPLLNINAGRWNFDITEKTGDLWIHINQLANVSPGDVVNYWVNAIVNRTGLQIQIVNQAFTLPGNPNQSTMSGDNTQGTTTPSQSTMSGDNTQGTTTPNQSTMSGDNTQGTTTPNQSTMSGDNPLGTTTPSTGDSNSTTVYIVAGAVLGVVLMICVTVICICIIRRRTNTSNEITKAKNVTDDEANKTHHYDKVDYYKQNQNQTATNVPNQNKVNINQTGNKNDVSINSRPLPVISSQNTYDYADKDHIVYDLPQEFKGQFQTGSRYEVLARDRDLLHRQTETYDKLSKPHSYLELTE